MWLRTPAFDDIEPKPLIEKSCVDMNKEKRNPFENRRTSDRNT
jgi:hypothetical protein